MKLTVLFLLSIFSALAFTTAWGQVGAPISTASSTLPTFEMVATPSVFVDHVGLIKKVTGSTTQSFLNIHFTAPWSRPYRSIVLTSSDGVFATGTLMASTTATGTISGAVSLPAPDFGAYTFRLWICDAPATSTKCGISTSLFIDVTDADAAQEIDRPPSDFTDADAEEVADVDRKNWLSWTRAMVELWNSDASAPSSYADITKLFPRYIPPDKLYWSRDPSGSTCSLDTIASRYPLVMMLSRASCMGLATTTPSFGSASSLYVYDAELLRALAKIKERSILVAGVPNYASGTPKFSFPMLVGSYDPVRGDRHDAQPSYLPLSKLNIVEYDGAHIVGNGTFMFDDSYFTTEKYYAGQCITIGCPHGMFEEFARMKKANTSLKAILRIRISSAILASSSLMHKSEDETMNFIRAEGGFDGVDIVPESLKDARDLISLVTRFRNERVHDAQLWLGVSTSCVNAQCGEILKEISGNLDALFVDASTLGSTAHYILPEAAIEDAVRQTMLSGVPANKIIIDVPSSGVFWSNDTWHMVDDRTIRKKYLDKYDFDRVYDEGSASVSLVGSSTGFVSYEDEESVSRKALLVLQNKLGGIRILNTVADDGVLVSSIGKIFGATDKTFACNIAMVPPRNLAENSRGKDVRALQDFLKCKDFIPGYIELNGSYGEITAAAMKLYQISEGIEPVGTVGSTTRASLQKYLIN